MIGTQMPRLSRFDQTLSSMPLSRPPTTGIEWAILLNRRVDNESVRAGLDKYEREWNSFVTTQALWTTACKRRKTPRNLSNELSWNISASNTFTSKETAVNGVCIQKFPAIFTTLCIVDRDRVTEIHMCCSHGGIRDAIINNRAQSFPSEIEVLWDDREARKDGLKKLKEKQETFGIDL
jgi:hypothetical protein